MRDSRTVTRMALSIKNEEADLLARELAELTGETLTEAVVVSLRERLARKRAEAQRLPLREVARDVSARFRALPLLDERSIDEILGYDDSGVAR